MGLQSQFCHFTVYPWVSCHSFLLSEKVGWAKGPLGLARCDHL